MAIETLQPPQTAPETKRFEGIEIQWGKVPWAFEHPRLGRVEIDTYSIWNPAHHSEIADRLASGERCALYMMGTFGVGQLFTPGDGHQILDQIKQRERTQNLVVFAHPDDIEDYIDFDRLPQGHRKLIIKGRRRKIYPGPMHAILPIKIDAMPSGDLVREQTKSTGFFWIPGHWGYESLIAEMRKKSTTGLFGGGSLNIHGQEPSFTTSDLRDKEMQMHTQWLTGIDFVILDEISEASGIGRSHTQVSFLNDPPALIRKGSISPAKIKRETGYAVVEDANLKLASSTTPYDRDHNESTDRKVEFALARMARLKQRSQS